MSAPLPGEFSVHKKFCEIVRLAGNNYKSVLKQWSTKYSIQISSLVPMPFEEEEKEPGTHCLRMLRYPKNLGGLDTIVNYSTSLIRMPVCNIMYHA